MKWVYVGAALFGGISLWSVGDSGQLRGASAEAGRVPAEVVAPRAAGPLVVLDPGHGGSNDGAPGVDGVHEKELTLVLALEVERRLVDAGVAVELTRRSDEYLTLRQRMRMANRIGAALFVSIHANATPQHAQRGYETFVLSPRAVDVDGPALRVEDGPARPGVDRDVARLLDDVERGAAQNAAADLAARMQRELRAVRGAAGDRGVRQDAHHVLLGATMPAVLVEVGFIDHPIEGRELLDAPVQDQLADAMAAAIAGQLGR